jgi:16S rRNA U516 pseudouridylate synthase RsuA-like enzyme
MRWPMRRVNWTITERQHRELKRLSQETGLPISELVRRALDKFIGLVGEGPLAAQAGSRAKERSQNEARP